MLHLGFHLYFLSQIFSSASDFIPELAYRQNESKIKEGSKYLNQSKTLYLIIMFGILTLLYLLITLFLLNDIENLNVLYVIISLVIILLCTVILLMIIPMLYTDYKTNEISKKNKQIKEENIVFIVLLLILPLTHIIIYFISSNYNFNDILLFNFIELIFILLSYKPIKIGFIKKRNKNKL